MPTTTVSVSRRCYWISEGAPKLRLQNGGLASSAAGGFVDWPELATGAIFAHRPECISSPVDLARALNSRLNPNKQLLLEMNDEDLRQVLYQR